MLHGSWVSSRTTRRDPPALHRRDQRGATPQDQTRRSRGETHRQTEGLACNGVHGCLMAGDAWWQVVPASAVHTSAVHTSAVHTSRSTPTNSLLPPLLMTACADSVGSHPAIHQTLSNLFCHPDPSRIETISWKPRAFVYHNLLTMAEVDHLVKIGSQRVSQ